MSYFSNGTEGEAYFEKYCAHCVHMPQDPEAGGCAVWLAHLLYSYQLCNEPDNPLDILIPRTGDKIGNQKCTMFLARAKDGAAQDSATENGGPTRADKLYMDWQAARTGQAEAPKP